MRELMVNPSKDEPLLEPGQTDSVKFSTEAALDREQKERLLERLPIELREPVARLASLTAQGDPSKALHQIASMVTALDEPARSLVNRVHLSGSKFGSFWTAILLLPLLMWLIWRTNPLAFLFQ
jgi:hypothetical protein